MIAEEFTPEERDILARYVTDVDGPVFALTNLPEVVKGALFARYSRSPKSLRRLFLDEFLDRSAPQPETAATGLGRAERLYERVFLEYGDDSVAQLGGVHLACEGASNLLTKVLEWGRLMAYLEQSTRYVPYDDRPGGRWRYHLPEELAGSPLLAEYAAALDHAFETYGRCLEPVQAYFRRRYPRAPDDPETVYRMTIRAKALDTLRGLLPAATVSNVGLYGTGQAYEALLLRMFAHPLAEVRACAQLMLRELRKVIPAFLRRVDIPERGGAWVRYLAETREATEAAARRLVGGEPPAERPEVILTEYDPEGELKVVAAALYAASDLPDDALLARVHRLSAEERAAVLAAYVGKRENRRHKPGRAFERTAYRFDILTDYGAFRDLQRHRLLTLEWQPLSCRHGYVTPTAVEEAGVLSEWERVMERCRKLHEAMVAARLGPAAQYAVPLAYRIRFYMQMNAREAMHIIELRTTPQGHPVYRRICQAMHRLIRDQAGHRAIAAAMSFADHSEVELERLEAERAVERRRREQAAPPKAP